MFYFDPEKTKKSKGTTLSLQEFNQRMEDSKVSAGQNIVYAPKKPMSSWADEVDDDGKKESEIVSEIQATAIPAGMIQII